MTPTRVLHVILCNTILFICNQIEHIKDVFKIDPLPIRGYHKAAAIVLLSVLIYHIMIYYNCEAGNKQPKAIKSMLEIYQPENQREKWRFKDS